MGRRDAEAFERLMGEAAECVKAGRLDEAALRYRRALRHQPNEWIALAHLGACERFAGRLSEAERVLRQALLVAPEEPGTLNELALVTAAAGRRAEAIAYLDRATRAAPGFLQGWTNLGKLLYVEHMEEEAAGRPAPDRRARLVACFERVLALDPSQAEFRLLKDAVSGARVEAPPEGYVAAFFDRFAAGFDDKVAGRLRYSAPAVAAEMLADLAPSGVRVLDLGCGTGLSGQVARACASRLAGVDLSPGMLARAAELGIYDELVEEDVAAFLARTPAAAYDLVLALDVFIYVGALEGVLGGVSRALASGGRVLFSVETLDGQGFRLEPSARFSHSRAYVENAAAAAGLVLREARAFAVREEAGRAIAAILFDFRKP